VQEIYEGEGENRHFVGYSKKYKLNDKKGALDSMSRYLGMFNDKVELTGKGGGPIQTAVNLSTLSEADLALMEALLKKAAGEGSE
jgi:hypothetical protein